MNIKRAGFDRKGSLIIFVPNNGYSFNEDHIPYSEKDKGIRTIDTNFYGYYAEWVEEDGKLIPYTGPVMGHYEVQKVLGTNWILDKDGNIRWANNEI